MNKFISTPIQKKHIPYLSHSFNLNKIHTQHISTHTISDENHLLITKFINDITTNKYMINEISNKLNHLFSQTQKTNTIVTHLLHTLEDHLSVTKPIYTGFIRKR